MLWKDLRADLGAWMAGTHRVRTSGHQAKPGCPEPASAEGTAEDPHKPKAHYNSNRNRQTYLGDDQVLGELGEANNVVKELRLLRKEVGAADELERVLQPEEALVALLVPVALADDLVRVDEELLVARPRAVAHVRVDQVPVAPVHERVLRLDVAAVREALAALVARPDQVVGLAWVEVQHGQPKGVRDRGRVHGVP